MRSCLMVVMPWFGLCLLLSAGPARAATVKGRVVDSTGQPVAGAEVSIWQKLPEGSNEQVKLGEGDVLLTAADGHFTTPNVLPSEAFVYIVAEAEGTLAGRSGWIEIGNDAAASAPNIVLGRLRAVIGRVVDRQGEPVAGATVFNSGDGHQRVESKTGSGGRFLLSGVPSGNIFLFAEKPGYHFTGTFLPAGEREATLTVSAAGDAVEPLTTLPPLMSADEETKLARESIDLDEVRKSGTERQKLYAVWALEWIDPLEVLNQIDSLVIDVNHYRDRCVEKLAALPQRLGLEKLVTLIESSDDHLAMTRCYLAVARHLDAEQRPRRNELFDRAMEHAMRIDKDYNRALALALVADALFSFGERQRAEKVIAEAQQLARSLSAMDFGALALATANVDVELALDLLEKTKGPRGNSLSGFTKRGGEIAVRLLPAQPDLAEKVWNRTQEPEWWWDGRRNLPQPPTFYSPLADFCFRLAPVDRLRVERVANAAETAAMRLRGHGAIALALADTQPDEARRLLESLVREEVPRVALDANSWFGSWTAPCSAAWLLPIAERVAPELCREIFWRSLALRLNRPRRDHLDGYVEGIDIELAKMLARHDRNMARALLEPLAERLPQKLSVATSRLKALRTNPAAQLKARHVDWVTGEAAEQIRELIIAAVYVDPRWAKELLDTVPVTPPGSDNYVHEELRLSFVHTLAQHGDRRQRAKWSSGAFWKPRSDDELDD